MVEGKGISIAALVCGITGIVLAFVPYVCVMGWVLGLLAIIFGGIGIAQTSKNPGKEGKGMAITGLVLGILSFVLPFLSMFLFAAIFTFL